jgi:hypothetical protein
VTTGRALADPHSETIPENLNVDAVPAVSS